MTRKRDDNKKKEKKETITRKKKKKRDEYKKKFAVLVLRQTNITHSRCDWDTPPVLAGRPTLNGEEESGALEGRAGGKKEASERQMVGINLE